MKQMNQIKQGIKQNKIKWKKRKNTPKESNETNQ